jgi:hypothetical protein
MFADDTTLNAKKEGLKTNHFETVEQEHIDTLPRLCRNYLAFSGCLWTMEGRLAIDKSCGTG